MSPPVSQPQGNIHISRVLHASLSFPVDFLPENKKHEKYKKTQIFLYNTLTPFKIFSHPRLQPCTSQTIAHWRIMGLQTSRSLLCPGAWVRRGALPRSLSLQNFSAPPGKFKPTKKINRSVFFSFSVKQLHTYIVNNLFWLGTSQPSTVAEVCTHTEQDRSMARAGWETGSSQIHFQCRAGTFTGFEFPYPWHLMKTGSKQRTLPLLLSLL